jgi:hypothetical protein
MISGSGNHILTFTTEKRVEVGGRGGLTVEHIPENLKGHTAVCRGWEASIVIILNDRRPSFHGLSIVTKSSANSGVSHELRVNTILSCTHRRNSLVMQFTNPASTAHSTSVTFHPYFTHFNHSQIKTVAFTLHSIQCLYCCLKIKGKILTARSMESYKKLEVYLH